MLKELLNLYAVRSYSRELLRQLWFRTFQDKLHSLPTKKSASEDAPSKELEISNGSEKRIQKVGGEVQTEACSKFVLETPQRGSGAVVDKFTVRDTSLKKQSKTFSKSTCLSSGGSSMLADLEVPNETTRENLGIEPGNDQAKSVIEVIKVRLFFFVYSFDIHSFDLSRGELKYTVGMQIIDHALCPLMCTSVTVSVCLKVKNNSN